MARYFQSTATTPISQFVELPLEFMQGQLDKRQIKRDAMVAPAALGLDPSIYSQSDTKLAQEKEAEFNTGLSNIVDNVIGDDWATAQQNIQKLKQSSGVTVDKDGNYIYKAGSAEDLLSTNKSIIDEYKKNIDTATGKDISEKTAWYNFNKKITEYDAAGGAAAGNVFNSILPSSDIDYMKVGKDFASIFAENSFEGAIQKLDAAGYYTGTVTTSGVPEVDVRNFYQAWLDNDPNFEEQTFAEYAYDMYKDDPNVGDYILNSEYYKENDEGFQKYLADKKATVVDNYTSAISNIKVSKQYAKSPEGEAYSAKLIKELDDKGSFAVSGGGANVGTLDYDAARTILSENKTTLIGIDNQIDESKQTLTSLITDNIPGLQGQFTGFGSSILNVDTTNDVEKAWNSLTTIDEFTGKRKLNPNYQLTLQQLNPTLTPDAIVKLGQEIETGLIDYNTYTADKIATTASVASQAYFVKDVNDQMQNEGIWTDDQFEKLYNSQVLVTGLDMTFDEYKNGIINGTITDYVTYSEGSKTAISLPINYEDDVKKFLTDNKYKSTEYIIRGGSEENAIGEFNTEYSKLFYNDKEDIMNITELSKLNTVDGAMLIDKLSSDNIDVNGGLTAHWSADTEGAKLTFTMNTINTAKSGEPSNSVPVSYVVDVQNNDEVLSRWQNAASEDYNSVLRNHSVTDASSRLADINRYELNYGASVTSGKLPMDDLTTSLDIGESYNIQSSDFNNSNDWTFTKDSETSGTLYYHTYKTNDLGEVEYDSDGKPTPIVMKVASGIGDNDVIRTYIGKVHLTANTKTDNTQ